MMRMSSTVSNNDDNDEEAVVVVAVTAATAPLEAGVVVCADAAAAATTTTSSWKDDQYCNHDQEHLNNNNHTQPTRTTTTYPEYSQLVVPDGNGLGGGGGCTRSIQSDDNDNNNNNNSNNNYHVATVATVTTTTTKTTVQTIRIPKGSDGYDSSNGSRSRSRTSGCVPKNDTKLFVLDPDNNSNNNNECYVSTTMNYHQQPHDPQPKQPLSGCCCSSQRWFVLVFLFLSFVFFTVAVPVLFQMYENNHNNSNNNINNNSNNRTETSEYRTTFHNISSANGNTKNNNNNTHHKNHPTLSPTNHVVVKNPVNVVPTKYLYLKATTMDPFNSSSTRNNKKKKRKKQHQLSIYNTSIPLLGPNTILDYYRDDSSLLLDLQNAVNFVFSSTLYGRRKNRPCRFQSNNDNHNCPNDDDYPDDFEYAGVDDDTTTSPENDDDGTTTTTDDTYNDDNDSDYGTNNQEVGIEEGDHIVSDGKYVYASYGRYFVIWDVRTGQRLKTISLPKALAIPSSLDNNKEPSFLGGSGGTFYTDVKITSLLLHDKNRLLVIVNGYGTSYQQQQLQDDEEEETTEQQQQQQHHVIREYMDTHIRLYDTVTLLVSSDTAVTAETGLVASYDVNGAFTAVRAMNGIAHIVTTARLNTYEYLVAPLETWNFDTTKTSIGYINTTDIRLEQIRNRFTSQVMKDLQGFTTTTTASGSTTSSSTSSISKIALWQEETSEDGMVEMEAYETSFLSTLVLVHALDMTLSTYDPTIFTLPSTGTFVPSHHVKVYGSTDKLVVTADVFTFERDDSVLHESTVLFVLALDSDSSNVPNQFRPHSYGIAMGTLLNSYSLDVYQDTLRVATTSRRHKNIKAPSNSTTFADGTNSTETMTTTSSSSSSSSKSNSTNSSTTANTTGTKNTTNTTTTGTTSYKNTTTKSSSSSSSSTGSKNGTTRTLAFVPGDPEWDALPDTFNYITVFQIPTIATSTVGTTIIDGVNQTTTIISHNASMIMMDQILLGKEKESFTSVRFFDEVAYAVTFLQTDPFYVLNMTNPYNISVLGELQITGYSSYLHPITPDHKILLAVGEEADIDGTTMGIKISLFDVRVPTNPIVIDTEIIEIDPNTYSTSEVLMDYKAIRYTPEQKQLYLPLRISTWYMITDDDTPPPPPLQFDGFKVYDIDINTGITETCSISHTQPTIDDYYGYNYNHDDMNYNDYYDGGDSSYYEDQTVVVAPAPRPLGGGGGEGKYTFQQYQDPDQEEEMCSSYQFATLPKRSMLFHGTKLLTTYYSEYRYTDIRTCKPIYNYTVPKICSE